jgi:hypothetical protein
MRTKNTNAPNTLNMITLNEPQLPRQVFYQPRQLTREQILIRQERQACLEPLPWGLEDSIVVYSLLSPMQANFWLRADEARALYEEMQTLWMKSGADQPLLRALANHQMQQTPIKKAVLLALGPMLDKCWDFPGLSHRGDSGLWVEWKSMVLRSMSQLVLFMRAVEYLSEQTRAPIKMYAQDPWFRDEDETFLRGLGFEMLHLPEAEAVTGADTFVYAPHMLYHHVVNSLSRCIRHQPAIYIGHDLGGSIENLADGVHAKGCSKDALKRDMSQLRAWKEAHLFFDVVEIHSGFENDAHGKAKVQIRKQAPTQEEMEQKCTPSCSWVPKFDPQASVKKAERLD